MIDHAAESEGTAPPATGIPALDAALEDIADLDHRPVGEHVAAFETAHVALRRPLDEPPAELDPTTSPA